jgi:hypothetical protein
MTKDPKFKVVFLSRPSDSPDALNALALGHVATARDLATKLGVDLEHVELEVRATSGAVVKVRLDRVP